MTVDMIGDGAGGDEEVEVEGDGSRSVTTFSSAGDGIRLRGMDRDGDQVIIYSARLGGTTAGQELFSAKT